LGCSEAANVEIGRQERLERHRVCGPSGADKAGAESPSSNGV
jgi:hypothetical protein